MGYKEDIIDIVSACSKSLDKQKEKAKALAENVDNIKAAQGAVASVTGSGRSSLLTDRSRRAAPTDCAGFITVVELVITLVASSPASPEVSVHSKEIVAAVSIVCSEDELASLMETEMEMEEAVEKVELAYEAVLEDILAQTGSTPTEEELEEFEPPPEEGEETTAADTTAAETTAAETTAAETTAAETTAAETTTEDATTTADETTTAEETTTAVETTTADETTTATTTAGTTTGATTSTTAAGTTSTTTAGTTTTTA